MQFQDKPPGLALTNTHSFSRRSDGLPVPCVHPVHPEDVHERSALLRASVDLREGVRFRDGQVRQEEGEGLVQAELRDALHVRDGVPVQVGRSHHILVCSVLYIHRSVFRVHLHGLEFT